MRVWLLLLLFFGCFQLYAQEFTFQAPDYKSIEKRVSDPQSEFYFAPLLSRYAVADTTLTLEQKRHLYYGFTFQEEYSPYGRIEFEDSLRVILEKQELVHGDFLNIVRYTDLILETNPFDLDAMDYQLFALDKVGESEIFERRVIQMNTIFEVLMSSGDGATKETAFYVIDTSHEYALLRALEFEFGGSQSLIEHFDYLTVEKNEYGLEGLYFDVTPCLKSLSLIK